MLQAKEFALCRCGSRSQEIVEDVKGSIALSEGTLRRPRSTSMPEPDRARLKPVTVPAKVTVYLADKAECRRVVGFAGVTQERNGRKAVKAV